MTGRVSIKGGKGGKKEKWKTEQIERNANEIRMKRMRGLKHTCSAIVSNVEDFIDNKNIQRREEEEGKERMRELYNRRQRHFSTTNRTTVLVLVITNITINSLTTL
jgi:hypothetical protein